MRPGRPEERATKMDPDIGVLARSRHPGRALPTYAERSTPGLLPEKILCRGYKIGFVELREWFKSQPDA